MFCHYPPLRPNLMSGSVQEPSFLLGSLNNSPSCLLCVQMPWDLSKKKRRVFLSAEEVAVGHCFLLSEVWVKQRAVGHYEAWDVQWIYYSVRSAHPLPRLRLCNHGNGTVPVWCCSFLSRYGFLTSQSLKTEVGSDTRLGLEGLEEEMDGVLSSCFRGLLSYWSSALSYGSPWFPKTPSILKAMLCNQVLLILKWSTWEL